MEYLKGCLLVLECVVYTLCCVEGEIFRQFGIERSDVVKEKVHVKVDELTLHRAIEPFTVSIHLWCLWIRMVVDNFLCAEKLAYVFLKLGAIVREDSVYGVWKE